MSSTDVTTERNDEMTQPSTRSPGSATLRLGFRTVDGVRIRYAESEGPADRTIVLTSPWPESVFAFAPVWSALASRFRLFAVDLPGFGASDQPADILSPKAIGAFLVRLIEDRDLGRPHIVAPDVGTSAALFAAAAHPERIASVIVGSGGAAVPIQRTDPVTQSNPVTANHVTRHGRQKEHRDERHHHGPERDARSSTRHRRERSPSPRSPTSGSRCPGAPEVRYPVALEECYAVARWIAEGAAGKGLGTTRVAVCGDSVGGNLATATAILAKQRGDIAFAAQALLYPVTDASFDDGSYRRFADGYWLTRTGMQRYRDQYTTDPDERDLITVSPLRAPSPTRTPRRPLPPRRPPSCETR